MSDTDLPHDFQLTDEEFHATKNVLPEDVRALMRRPSIMAARTTAFEKVTRILRKENDMLTERAKNLALRHTIDELEGNTTELEALRRQLEVANRTVEHRELEIANMKAERLRELAAPAMAVHS